VTLKTFVADDGNTPLLAVDFGCETQATTGFFVLTCDSTAMDDALRRRLDAALALLAVIAFATLSVAFSPATAVALALVSGLLGALLRMEWSVPTPEE
jgi:hypothetical protein